MLRHLKYIIVRLSGVEALYLLAFTLFFSCKNSDTAVEDTSKLVAKAGEEELRYNEFSENFIYNGNVKDSNYVTKKLIEDWATESLFYQEAMTKLTKEEIDIERQVKAYRKQLVNYIYQTKLVDANLDTNVSKKEIEEYYDNNRDNFILKDNIVKVNYIKIPVKSKVIAKIKSLLYATLPKDKETLKSLCIQNAENFFINDSTWLYLEDIKKEIPKLNDQPDFNLSKGRVVEFTDEYYYYYLKITDEKIKNGLSPINFERQNIKNFIINNRKTLLIKQYKKQLFDKAVAEKKFARS